MGNSSLVNMSAPRLWPRGGESAALARGVITYAASTASPTRRRHGPPRPLNVLSNVLATAPRDFQRIRRRREPTRPTSAARATSNITSARHPISNSTEKGASLLLPTLAPRTVDPWCSARRARCRQPGRQAWQDVPADPAPGDAAFADRRIRRMPRLLRPAGLRHRRNDPLHHQQPGRFHHLAAIRPLVALSVGHRQVGPGADPARQCRRSGSGDFLLQDGDRIPSAVRPRHRHRHVVLPPVRSQ